jgi:catabolite regulation protein CreA
MITIRKEKSENVSEICMIIEQVVDATVEAVTCFVSGHRDEFNEVM